MIFTLNSIEFDFSYDGPVFEDELGDDYQLVITKDALEHKWVADDEDDLIETITADTGWCIKSIDYEVFLNDTE